MNRHFVTLAIAAALAACGAALASGEAVPLPPAPAAEDAEMARLERAFWACDYVATTEGIGATPAAACRYVTEELKQQKFGGSFNRFLEWWRANKPAEHRRMAQLAES